jgi:hypothetical protein
VLATPVRAAEPLSASVSLGYAEMVARLHRTLPVHVLDGSITFSADIVRGRNRIAAKVLRELPNVTHILWVDDDNWCDDPAIVPEMLALGVDVVSAPYTNKRQPLRWVHQQLSPAASPVGDLLEVAGVGFGFTLTTTHVLRELSAEARIYTDHPHPHRVANLFGHLYYHPAREAGPGAFVPPENDALLSEDFSFCFRLRRRGGKVYVYTKGGIINHAGPHTWSAKEMAGVVC